MRAVIVLVTGRSALGIANSYESQRHEIDGAMFESSEITLDAEGASVDLFWVRPINCAYSAQVERIRLLRPQLQLISIPNGFRFEMWVGASPPISFKRDFSSNEILALVARHLVDLVTPQSEGLNWEILSSTGGPLRAVSYLNVGNADLLRSSCPRVLMAAIRSGFEQKGMGSIVSAILKKNSSAS